MEIKRFTLESWLILCFSIALILLNISQTIYRFPLPTDGWIWHTGSFGGGDENILIYDANLVGNPSALQPGDRVITVTGLPVAGGDLAQNPDAEVRLAGIQAGDRIEYSILRGDQALKIEVILTHWTLAAWIRANISPSSLAFLLTGWLMIGVGLFTFFKRPELPSARALLLWCTAIFCVMISGSLPDSLYNFLDPIAYLGVSLFSYSIFIWLLAPSLLSFTLVFPKPKPIVLRLKWMALAPFFIGILILALILIDPRFGVLGWIGTMLMLLASAVNLIHSAFTQRDAVSQAQLRWAVGGVILGIGVSLLTFLTAFDLVTGLLGEIFGSGVSIGFAIISISLSIAILRYRLWDIEVIIRRTLIYGLLTAVLAVVYFGSVIILEGIFRRVIGPSGQSQAAIVISTLCVAALFSPLRRRIQNTIDRRFFRRNYNAELILQTFATSLRDEVDIDQLSDHLVNIVEETMQPSSVSLWRIEPGKG